MGKKNKKKKSHLPFRLNVLFFIIFLMFSGVVLKLGMVQILHGAEAQEEINRTTNDTTKKPVPRGKMYDRYGNVIVDNSPLYAITYTPPKSTNQGKHLEIAKKLAPMIEKDTKKVTLRDKKDYWILVNNEDNKAIKERLSVEEQTYTEEEQETGADTPYEILLDRIDPEQDLQFSDQVLEIIAIKRELDSAYSLSPHIVKNEGVTLEEYATVAENLDKLPGINVSTDWQRKYPYGDTFRNYLGSVSMSGIPKDEKDHFMSLGYSLNDRVGTSGLEKRYEMVLKGQKEKVEHTVNSDQEVINSEVIQEGTRGDDLRLTVDMELQKRLDEIVQKHLKEAITRFPVQNQYMSEAMVVMMDPDNGEVLAVSGQKYNRGEDGEKPYFQDFSLGAITQQYAPGSAVKGATVLAGYDSGVINYGERINDNIAIQFKDTPKKASYKALGTINDIQALEKSSNVYMYNIAIRIAGHRNYVRNETMNYTPGSFQVMRDYYSQFGLGVKTGLDMPAETESAGLQGKDFQPGNIMDLAIGQYDNYTTMQLAQYVSTIANDGYRIQPRLVNEVHEPDVQSEGLGPIIESYSPNVLNKISMTQNDIDRVKRGFERVFQSGGTAYSNFGEEVDYSVAGKTGTAEAKVYDIIRDEFGNAIGVDGSTDVEHLTLVGYSPAEDPEVAFAVVVPNTGEIDNYGQYPINKHIGRDAMNAYYDLKENRAEAMKDQEQSEEEDQEESTDQ
ncbi:penicillin-binding protein [Pontibacillus chungwhensis BH030062]|uniref:serine-type D-Ala-D-Ala carboxypeptidase n=1 Tax=Pontibacillus chungwhensis BH030062 TaxID=1385513 RepID=A0A0A2UYX8_9BACI|nr:penicillin-binding protein 2 [Pontibacillus chungwhensis]KGP91973.1 penicillin-binding protein [Pontibacillus chungwhensis BH030062]